MAGFRRQISSAGQQADRQQQSSRCRARSHSFCREAFVRAVSSCFNLSAELSKSCCLQRGKAPPISQAAAGPGFPERQDLLVLTRLLQENIPSLRGEKHEALPDQQCSPLHPDPQECLSSLLSLRPAKLLFCCRIAGGRKKTQQTQNNNTYPTNQKPTKQKTNKRMHILEFKNSERKIIAGLLSIILLVGLFLLSKLLYLLEKVSDVFF